MIFYCSFVSSENESLWGMLLYHIRFFFWQETTGRAKQWTRPTNQRSWKTVRLGSSRCSICSPTLHYHQGFMLWIMSTFFSDSRFSFSRSLIQLSISLQLLVWYSSWVWRYKVKKAPYSFEDASYLTRRSLGVPLDAWTNLGILLFTWTNTWIKDLILMQCVDLSDEYKKEDLVQRRLWEKQNLENYYAEMRKESKRRR